MASAGAPFAGASGYCSAAKKENARRPSATVLAECRTKGRRLSDAVPHAPPAGCLGQSGACPPGCGARAGTAQGTCEYYPNRFL